MTLDQIQALTDEEIRVRVAELRGWTYAGSDSTTRFYCPPGTTDLAKRHGFIPNYPADLNACHEFELAQINATNEALYRNFLILQCGEWK